MKKLTFALMLLTFPAYGQTVSPSQIKPSAASGQVLTTVTGNQPPQWAPAFSLTLQTNGTPNISQSTLNLEGATGLSVTNPSGGNVLFTPVFQSLTTAGTSGAATLSGGVLNIPQYSGGGGSGVQYNAPTTNY